MDQRTDKPPTIGWNIDVAKPERSRSRSPNDKKRKTSRTSSTSTTSSDTSSSSDDSDRRKARHERRKIKKEKKLLRKQQKREAKDVKRELKRVYKESKREAKKELKQEKSQKHKEEKLKKSSKMEVEEDFGVPINLMNTKALIPETKEEYEKRQNVIRRIVDPETGRQRLIKGDGEVLEEIVSRNRHLDINKKATAGDGQFFQNQTLGWNDLNK